MSNIIKVTDIRQCDQTPLKTGTADICEDQITLNEFNCADISGEDYYKTSDGICYTKNTLLHAINTKKNLFNDILYPNLFKIARSMADIEQYKVLLGPEYEKIYNVIIKEIEVYKDFFSFLNDKKYFALLRTISYVFMDVGINSKIFIDKVLVPTFKEDLTNSTFYKLLEINESLDDAKLISDPQCQWQLLIKKEREHFFETPDKYVSFIQKNQDFYKKLLKLDTLILEKDLINNILLYESKKQTIYDEINTILLDQKQSLLGVLTQHTIHGVLDTNPNKHIYDKSVYQNDQNTAILNNLIFRSADFMGCVKGLGATLLKRVLFAKDFLKIIKVVDIDINILDSTAFEEILTKYLIQIGGNKNYKNKYLKYKQKYLKLKESII
jgi:hypothetical protein